MTRKILQTVAPYSFLLAAIFALSFQIDAQTKKEKRKAKDLVEQAGRAFDQKNYRTSVGQYAEALAIVPNDAFAHYQKGRAHYYLSENDLALTELDLALKHGHKAQEIYKLRWDINFKNKNYDAALEDVKQIQKSESNNPAWWVAAGDINVQKGTFAEALDAYQRAVVKLPNNADLYYKIAYAQSRVGNIEGQASAAEEAIKKHTQYLPYSYVLLGDARQRQRRFPEAIDAYKRALASKPDQIDVYRSLGDVYRSENRLDEAIEISKEGLRQSPNNGLIYTDISWYYSLAGKHEEAVQSALAGTRLLPNAYLAYTNLCRAYIDTGKLESAIAACNSALRLNPGDGETHYYLGRAHNLAGRSGEATKNYKLAVVGLEKFTKDNPDYSDGFYLLGNAYYADYQRDKAIEAYKKCLELNPRFSKATYNIGIIQVGQKNKTAALEQYNSLLIIDKALAGKLKEEIDKM